MKKYLLLGFLALGSCAAFARAGFTTPRDAGECSDIFFNALLEENSGVLNNVLADDFSMVSFDGQPIDRHTLSEAVTQGYLTIDTGMLSGARVRNYGEVGIVTGLWNVKGRIEANGFQNQVAYTVVAVKSAGIWKVTNVQLTPIR
jgi:hypothetical protein